jgi:hypothetical protein
MNRLSLWTQTPFTSRLPPIVALFLVGIRLFGRLLSWRSHWPEPSGVPASVLLEQAEGELVVILHRIAPRRRCRLSDAPVEVDLALGLDRRLGVLDVSEHPGGREGPG